MTATSEAQIAAQYPGGNGIALDSSFAYLTDNGDAAVKRMPRAGGPLETVATGQIGVYEIHVHNARVCWRAQGEANAENTTIWCSSTTSFDPHQVVETGDDLARVFSFDFDEHDVYYVFPPYIFRAPLDGSSPPAIFATDDEPRQPFSPMSLSTQQGFLYWASVTSDGNGSIRRCAAGNSCSPEILSTYPSQGTQDTNLVTSTTHVYWTSASQGDVYRVPLDGGSTTHLAACPGFFPQSIAVDNNAVYWASESSPEDEAQIWHLPLDGSPASEIGSTKSTPAEPPIMTVAAIDTGALWTTFDWKGATLWRSPAP